MIVERLQSIMSHYKLSASSLADVIGVPRSSISHLLSGRNKPSLDFVLKLIKAYPEVNLYWLLSGKGEFPSKTSVLDEEHNPKRDLVTNLKNKTSEPKGKSVSKIVFFYDDGTFETYHPKK